MAGGCHLQVDAPKEPGADIERKEAYKNYMRVTLNDLRSVENPRDMLKEQHFTNSIESYTEQAYLYHDELTRMISLSVIPN